MNSLLAKMRNRMEANLFEKTTSAHLDHQDVDEDWRSPRQRKHHIPRKTPVSCWKWPQRPRIPRTWGLVSTLSASRREWMPRNNWGMDYFMSYCFFLQLNKRCSIVTEMPPGKTSWSKTCSSKVLFANQFIYDAEIHTIHRKMKTARKKEICSVANKYQ